MNLSRKLTRLEPVSVDYSMEIGIQSRIKDPLALLGRQWTIGEFRQQHNGGHAVRVSIDYQDQVIDKIKLSGVQNAQATFEHMDTNSPLEKAIEQETDSTPLCKGWNDKRLEYQFSVGHGNTELFAEQNYGFSDWFSFDLKSIDLSTLETKNLSGPPSAITFGGMPLPRWWSIEDRNHDLSGISRPDLNFLSLIMVEFSLLFPAYDYYTVAMKHPVGTLRRIAKVTTVDSFGVATDAQPVIDKTAQRSGWELFTLQPSDGSYPDGRIFYYPNTLGASLEGSDLESVSFFRDSISNLLWAIEEKYQQNGETFSPADAKEDQQPSTSLRPYYYWDIVEKKLVTPDEKDADARADRYYGPVELYNPMTEMPDYWVPYQPGYVDNSGSYVFRRSRTRENTGAGPQYHSQVINESKEIYEEEITDVGIKVKRCYQVARDNDGNLCMWLGRKKLVDDKKKFSGLLFDYLISSYE